MTDQLPTSFIAGDAVVIQHPQIGRVRGELLAPAQIPESYGKCGWTVRVPPYITAWTVPDQLMTHAVGTRDMVPGDLIPLATLKAAYEREFLGTLWTHGDSGHLTPYVCEHSHGDGLKLLQIFTINQRPNYHLVRVDSGWKSDEISDQIDNILSAIEEECGRAGAYLDQPCDRCGDTACKCGEDYSADEAFPALDDRDGCSWNVISFAEMLHTIAKRNAWPN